jgi:hypothetical protein
MEALKTLLQQKKFIMTILGLVASITARYGFNLPVEEAATILTAFMVYVYSQGKADTGKEAALIQAANPKPEHVNIQNVNPAPPEEAPSPILADEEDERVTGPLTKE